MLMQLNNPIGKRKLILVQGKVNFFDEGSNLNRRLNRKLTVSDILYQIDVGR